MLFKLKFFVIYSPEETSDAGLLIDIGSSSQNDSKNNIKPTDFTKLVDIQQSSLNLNNENYLINVDNVNSNILSSEKTLTSFDDNLQKKPDAPVVGKYFILISNLISLTSYFNV